MIGRIITLFVESRAVRHFSLAGLAIVGGGLVAADLVARTLDATPDRLARAGSFETLAVRRAPPANPMRSVLDDDVVTGSVRTKAAATRLDPCTGQER